MLEKNLQMGEDTMPMFFKQFAIVSIVLPFVLSLGATMIWGGEKSFSRVPPAPPPHLQKARIRFTTIGLVNRQQAKSSRVIASK